MKFPVHLSPQFKSPQAFGLVAFGLCVLSGCNSPQQTAEAPPANPQPAVTAQTQATPQAFVRGVNVVPGANLVSIAVDDKSVTPGFTFGNASGFVGVTPGKLKINAFGSDGKSVSGPMPVTMESGEDMTVVVNGVPGDIAMLPFKHKNGGPENGQSKVAFLHAAKGLPDVDVFIDGTRYRGGVDYGDNTDYKTLKPGRHTMQVYYSRSLPSIAAPTPVLPPGTVVVATPVPVKMQQRVTLTQQLDLMAGKVYSVVIFYGPGKLPKLRLLEDQFADTLKNAPKT